MFTITKAFVAAMAATAVLAAPELKSRQATPPLANCDFVLTSDVAVPANTNLVAEFNFVIGRALADVIPTNTEFFNQGSTFTNTGGNTFDIKDSLGVDGKTAAQTAALVESLAGTTSTGFARPAINWTINSVTCTA